ncbi:MAG: N-acetylmuramoyl-L-alanine amidase [Candidatus Omnitrophica bacterium]|nr:N-acetylmuramoyl-L-alanine amidase [Candidatus Omnitrophota bacterium]
MKIKNQLVLILASFAIILSLNGCATVPPKETFPTYNLNGATYYPLIALCEAKGISWQYDTFTRVVILEKDAYKVSLKAGDNLVLVGQRAMLLNYPVDIYAGTIVVPDKFKTQVIDVLFKEVSVPAQRLAAFPVSTVIQKVVIDAGHGGNDPGAIGRTGLKEKDVNLDIARRLALLLRSEGVEVVMTRSNDRFIPLNTRVKISNHSRSDIFVSIHSNANRVRSLNGFEVYYVAISRNDARRALFASRNANLNLDNASFAGNSLELRAILWDMLYAYDRAESIQLARSICRSVDSNLDVRVIGAKDARYEVLREARIPAVLVETGFLSNYNEERMLKNSAYRQKVAESIMEGIRDYAQALASTEVAKQ